MSSNWPTRDKDMEIAQLIMEEYAQKSNTDALGLFELVVNTGEKRMDFRLASWVLALAHQFNAMYGDDQGDVVVRQVITHCITRGEVLH